jgi:Golgi SNAP receptor complex protein 1
MKETCGTRKSTVVKNTASTTTPHTFSVPDFSFSVYLRTDLSRRPTHSEMQPSAAASATSLSATWDDLRLQARRIERDVDAKLATLMDATQPEQKIIEIESGFRRLAELHDAMHRCASQSPTNNAGLLLTLQRHRELLNSYQSDLRMAKTTITSAREREELLGGVRVEVDGTRSDLLLRERASLHNSERIAETVLGCVVLFQLDLNAFVSSDVRGGFFVVITDKRLRRVMPLWPSASL